MVLVPYERRFDNSGCAKYLYVIKRGPGFAWRCRPFRLSAGAANKESGPLSIGNRSPGARCKRRALF